ncbi:ATP-binding cassette domain-containing protein [Rothia nasimurium]|uniref:ABC transporter ATP-binding protein n=1 Tax=Rothia nasimurium TaxID=85336 RepID=UPI001430A087|nr:ATP-binding cassette domain-containing protein [Rothia nasimurium]MBF0808863.1 ATP-binding cassette domain-containing protein [Rothia nasimurium]
MIFVENLSYTRRRHRVLYDLNFTLAPGATALLGHNGAGKSTLFSLLATALKPTQGSIGLQVGSQRVDSRRQGKQYRKHIVLVPQQYRPVPGLSVEQHIQYVSWLASNPSSKANRLAQEAIEATSLQGLVDRKTTELSGGETQRLAIAGALATGARTLLLDEPTAGLDPSHKDAINQLIQTVGQERVVLVATHDLYQLDKIYQHVLALKRGHLTFSGQTYDFLAPFSGSPQQQAPAAFNYFIEQ